MMLVLLIACQMDVVYSEEPPLPPDRGMQVPELVGIWTLTSEDNPVVSIARGDRAMTARFYENDAWTAPRPLPLKRIRGELYTQLQVTDVARTDTYTPPASGMWWPLALELDGDQLTVSRLDPDWFYARQGQDVGVEFLFPSTVVSVTRDGKTSWSGSNVVLRGSGRELRRWLRRHHDEEGLLTPFAQLQRTSATPAP